jgi:hypothetical protein
VHPSKVDRTRLRTLTDLPNVGPAMAGDFVLLGYETPQQLVGADPQALFDALCERTGVRQDPCVLDTIMSVTRFLAGDDSAERKARRTP